MTAPATRPALLALLVLALCAGCPAKAQVPRTAPPPAAEAEVDHPSFVVITMDKSRDRYVIDPRSESCLLILGRTATTSRAPVHVSCDALKRNLPAAAEHIKWTESTTATADAGNKFDDMGVMRISDTLYRVKRRFFTEMDSASYGKGARLVPAIKNGKPAGFKLYAVRPSSVYARLGIVNGDRIYEINNRKLSTPDTALDLIANLPTMHRIEVKLERRGRVMTIVYEIVE